MAEMILLDHYQNPRARGFCQGEQSLSRKAFNPACGDSFNISMTLEEADLSCLKIEGQGCALSVAASSIMANELQGLSRKEASDFLRDYLENLEAKPFGSQSEKTKFSEEFQALFFATANPARALCASICAQETLYLLENY